MKNLKIKFGLFSLLAILAVSVFLTSCEQDVLLDDIAMEHIAEQNIELGDIFQLTIPDNMSHKEMVEWLDNLDQDEVEELTETAVLTEVEARGCFSWSPWIHSGSGVSCSGCTSPPARHTNYYYRYRYCPPHTVDYQSKSIFSCKTYC